MAEPEFGSTGEPLNEAARQQVAAQDARHDVEAAQHEAAAPVPDDAPPPGSWRAQLDEYEAATVSMSWDGTEWEIPAKMPNDYYDAVRAADSRATITAVLGFEGLRRLRIPSDIDAELLSDLAESVSEAAGKVWSLPNLNRSARRSRGTTRR